MVEEGRKSLDVNGAESMAVPVHSLKLKINLRDRQNLRKRRRSVSPDASSDSSSKEQERPSVVMSPSVKKSHKEHRHRNGTDDADSSSMGSKQMNGAVEILCVDMNGTSSGYGEGDESSSSSHEKFSFRSDVSKAKTLENSIQVEAAAGIIKRLPRDELERIFLEQMCFALRERGVTGALERQLESSESQLDRFRRKTEQLHKQVNDLTAVIRRYVSQSKGRKEGVIPPVKITRAVGLQVNCISQAVPTQPIAQNIPVATPIATPISTISPVKKPLFQTAHLNRLPVKPSVTVTPATSNPPPLLPQQPVNHSPNLIGSRVPLPPSFTMQSPDIASYVPQQAMPRYRTSSKKSLESSPCPSPQLTSPDSNPPSDGSLKMRFQTKAGSIRLEGISKLSPAPPLKQIVPMQPQQQRILAATSSVASTPLVGAPLIVQSVASDSSATRTRIINGQVVRSTSNPSLSAVKSAGSTSSAPATVPARTPPVTTVNKVTLPGMPPRVIDLTDDEQEKDGSTSGRQSTGATVSKSSPSPAAASSSASSSGYHVLSKIAVPATNPKPSPPASSVITTVAVARPPAPKPSVQMSGVISVRTSTISQNGSSGPTGLNSSVISTNRPLHPASLPPTPLGPVNPAWKPLPPRPSLKISRVSNGIVLSWTMQGTSNHADIASYQLYAYQEGSMQPSPALWKKVGDVKALPLPMACTLTQFLEGHRYHFAVRAMDVHGRAGPYSEPNSIVLS